LPTFTPYGGLPPGSELLVNGGFEVGVTPWQSPSWNSSLIVVDDQVKRTGTRSLRFQGNSPGPYVYQELPAAPGDAFTFSGWVNMMERLGDETAVVELVARPTGSYDLKTFPVATIASPTNGWVQITGSAVMPSQTAKLWVRIRFPRLNGKVYFDDLSLIASGGGPTATPTSTVVNGSTATGTPTPTPSAVPTSTPTPTSSSTPTSTLTATKQPTTSATATNLPASSFTPTATATDTGSTTAERLINGGFESGLDGWVLPSWYANVAGIDGAQAYTGTHSLRFSGNLSGPYVYQELTAQAGDRFDVSAWVDVQAQNAGSAMTIELVARHADGWEIRSLPIGTVGTTTSGWINVKGSAVMPDRTAKAWLRVRFAQLNGMFAIDDVSVKPSAP